MSTVVIHELLVLPMPSFDFKLHGMQPCSFCCGNKTYCLGRQYGGWRRDGLKKEELRPAACLVYIGCSKSLHIHFYMPVLEFLIILYT